MPKTYIIDIESNGRYSDQWVQIEREANPVAIIISGTQYNSVTAGGFFDFNKTNIYKAEQTIKLAQLFSEGKIEDGDQFVFHDVWHPGVISLKYMIDMAGLKCRIVGYLHAGSYDPTDLLGMKGLDKWADDFENSVFKCCDEVWVASDYHCNMVLAKRKGLIFQERFLFDLSSLDKFKTEEKENIMLFPHRISPDKQPEIFRDLSKHFPDLQFIMTQEQNLDKDEYYKLVAKSKYIFSASLHENWGISVFEAVYLGCQPVLPNRCSYSEMYGDTVKLYPSEWTLTYESFKEHEQKLVDFIKMILEDDWENTDTVAHLKANYITNFEG